MSIKKIFEMPLPELKEAVKGFVDVVCDYWEKQLGTEKKENTQETEDTRFKEEEQPETAYDIKKIIADNVAIVEKFQIDQVESLFNHLASLVAKERNCEVAEIEEELKSALYIHPEKRTLLSMDRVKRTEYVVSAVLDEEGDVVDRIQKAESKKDAYAVVDEVIEKCLARSFGIISKADFSLAVRQIINQKMNEK